MSIMHRIALSCGIVGGVWAVLASVAVLLRVTGAVWYHLLFLFVALMGALGLSSTVLSRRSHKLGKSLLSTSAAALLLVGLVDIFGIGVVSLPASVLLVVAAIGLKS